MKYKYEVEVKSVMGIENPLVVATLQDEYNRSVHSGSWINIPLKDNNIGELLRNVTERMFPKPAEEEVKKLSSPIKTTRGNKSK